MFILEIIYHQSLEEVNIHMEAHKAYLDKYYEAGNFLLSGRKVPRDGGIIIATFTSMDAVNRAINEDPFVQHGLAEYRVTEFMPTRRAPALYAVLPECK